MSSNFYNYVYIIIIRALFGLIHKKNKIFRALKKNIKLRKSIVLWLVTYLINKFIFEI